MRRGMHSATCRARRRLGCCPSLFARRTLTRRQPWLRWRRRCGSSRRSFYVAAPPACQQSSDGRRAPGARPSSTTPRERTPTALPRRSCRTRGGPRPSAICSSRSRQSRTCGPAAATRTPRSTTMTLTTSTSSSLARRTFRSWTPATCPTCTSTSHHRRSDRSRCRTTSFAPATRRSAAMPSRATATCRSMPSSSISHDFRASPTRSSTRTRRRCAPATPSSCRPSGRTASFTTSRLDEAAPRAEAAATLRSPSRSPAQAASRSVRTPTTLRRCGATRSRHHPRRR